VKRLQYSQTRAKTKVENRRGEILFPFRRTLCNVDNHSIQGDTVLPELTLFLVCMVQGTESCRFMSSIRLFDCPSASPRLPPRSKWMFPPAISGITSLQYSIYSISSERIHYHRDTPITCIHSPFLDLKKADPPQDPLKPSTRRANSTPKYLTSNEIPECDLSRCGWLRFSGAVRHELRHLENNLSLVTS
jgi:hypothetical protein